jgi:hypothetical protein
VVLQQPMGQEQGHVALPCRQGHRGQEINDSRTTNNPAPVDEDITKPIRHT